MNDLTEQWKKGELPEGDYYISNGDEIYPDYYDSAEGFLKIYNYGVRRVLAEVPDYVEWKAILEENAQLKELLKECREVIKNVDTYYGNYDSAKGYLVINKIDEVLK